MPFYANDEKTLEIDTEYGKYNRYPIKTHVIKYGDKLEDILEKYVCDYLQDGDFIFLSEKIVAITQGRAIPIDEIKPSFWARFLTKFVYKTPYGIGLGIPETMELAIREIGLFKILFAAFCSAVTKPFGLRGVFYKVCGPKARAIDGPCDHTIPPYNKYAVLSPEKPDSAAAVLAKKIKSMKENINCFIIIIDANDIGVDVLGRSCDDIDIGLCRRVFADNPLDQADQQTPIAIVRKAV